MESTAKKRIELVMVRKAGLEPASLSALAPKASVFALYLLKIQRFEKVEEYEWQF